MKLYHLQCMHQNFAVGVDTRTPCFSWKTEANSSEGNFQTACQIQITNLWGEVLYDTGKLQQSAQFIYLSLPFIESVQKYGVRVCVWDELGNCSGFCSPVYWITGILEQPAGFSFLLPENSGADLQNDTFLYQGELADLSEEYDTAVILVASVGMHELYLNGKKVGTRLMAPSRSKIQPDRTSFITGLSTENGMQRAQYVAYDVTHLLQKGSNTVAVWVDAGWARAYQMSPMVGVQWVLRRQDKVWKGVSDPLDWKCRRMNVRHIGRFDWGDFGGEEIDGGCVGEILPVCENGWEAVRSAEWTGALSADLLAGDQVLQQLCPVSITRKDDSFVVDMGQNFTGFIRFRVDGEADGTAVEIFTADKPSEKCSFGQHSRLIIGSGSCWFGNRFNFAAGRYITISGLHNPPQQFVGLVVGNAFERTGHFNCSEPLLNAIYQADLDTFTANTVNGVTTDCPHRERLGYGETGISTCWGIGNHAFEMQEFYRQSFRGWRDRQTADGFLPHVSPNWEGGGGTVWSSCLTISLWDRFQLTGDRQLVNENYRAAVNWANFLLNHLDCGLLQRYPQDGYPFGYLGDWATFERDDWGYSVQASYFNNTVCLYLLKITAQLAEIMEDTDTGRMLQQAHRDMRLAIWEKFFCSPLSELLIHEQRYLAVALCADLPPAEEWQKIAARLETALVQKGYLDGGSAGLTFIYRAVLEHLKKPELVYQMLCSEQLPSFGYFIRQGQNTWPEMWRISDIYGGSRIHTCYTGVSGFIVRGLAGIRPQVGRPEVIELCPLFPQQLSHLECSQDTGFGKVSFEWQRTEKNISIHLVVPFNTRVVFHLPDGSEKQFCRGSYTFVVAVDG